jgi:hypothetical protein
MCLDTCIPRSPDEPFYCIQVSTLFSIQLPSKPKINDKQFSSFSHDIMRLEVLVHYAGPMNALHNFKEFQCQSSDFLGTVFSLGIHIVFQ